MAGKLSGVRPGKFSQLLDEKLERETAKRREYEFDVPSEREPERRGFPNDPRWVKERMSATGANRARGFNEARTAFDPFESNADVKYRILGQRR